MTWPSQGRDIAAEARTVGGSSQARGQVGREEKVALAVGLARVQLS